MTLGSLFLTNAVAIGAMMLMVWIISLLRKDVSIVDIFWGLGFVLVAILTQLCTESDSPRKALLVTLTTLWGIRLSAYLAWRNHRKPEDYRYRAMRDARPIIFPYLSLLTVFGLQGLIMCIVSLPVQAGQIGGRPLNWIDLAGITLWIVGFLFEFVADLQLARFKAVPANQGKVLDGGLWKYTRHPNYFGDFLVWWGLYLIAAASASPWWIVVAPIVMTVLLMRISGVTLLESSLRTRKNGYEDYIRRTSAFFPRLPRS